MAELVNAHVGRCIAYDKGVIDTHAAHDGKYFNVVADGEYAWLENGKLRVNFLKAGTKIKTDSILNNNCGRFYRDFIKRHAKE